MKGRNFRAGDVISYPYLWKREQAGGESEGRKIRPVCVIVALTSSADGSTHLALLAISGSPPSAAGRALEIPEMECRRAGLREWKKAWIIINEYNYDVVERSYYLDSRDEPMGRFGKAFMMKLATAIAPMFAVRQGRVQRIN